MVVPAQISHRVKILFRLILIFVLPLNMAAQSILIPMDADGQTNHLKAYGIAFWVLDCFTIICLIGSRFCAVASPRTLRSSSSLGRTRCTSMKRQSAPASPKISSGEGGEEDGLVANPFDQCKLHGKRSSIP